MQFLIAVVEAGLFPLASGASTLVYTIYGEVREGGWSGGWLVAVYDDVDDVAAVGGTVVALVGRLYLSVYWDTKGWCNSAETVNL